MSAKKTRRAVMNTKKLQAGILGAMVAAAAFAIGPDAKSDPALTGEWTRSTAPGKGASRPTRPSSSPLPRRS